MQLSNNHVIPGALREFDGSRQVDQPSPPPDYPGRRQRALERMRAAHDHADALVICDPLDIQYLTGTRHGISWLVVSTAGCFAVSRHMLISEVREQAVDCEILLACGRSTERPDMEAFVLDEVSRRRLGSVLIDPSRIAAQSYLHLARHAGDNDIQLTCEPEFLACQRGVKDAAELELVRRCVNIAEAAFEGLVAAGSANLIGRTEREIADELESRMWALGADRQGFPETGIIVASGPHSASAHHSPGDRRVRSGEPLLIDWGAEVTGYRSDMTRTIFPESVPSFALQAYPVVERALLRAAAQLRPGASMGEIDRIARSTVTDAGYTEFHYGVGHGVGLAIHETPWLRANSEELCEKEMITTIEPGIYLPKLGGIRIENLYRLATGGSECLCSLPTDLDSMVIGL
jgi:Xaa-Pro aminopeptidase